jgi:hypothetical protein
MQHASGWERPTTRATAAAPSAFPCPVCFETISQLQWLPPFQHIVGNYWLLTHVPYGHDWVRAEKDAPWRRYTNLQVDIQESYARARIDWWFTEYHKTFPYLAWFLVVFLPLAIAALLVLFLFEVWRARRRAPPLLAEDFGGSPREAI